MTQMIRVVLLAMILSGCQLIGPEEGSHIDEKTFPSASDLPLIQLEDIEDPAIAPGEYNIEAFVVSWNECPGEGDGCQFPDGISISSKNRVDYGEDFWWHIPLQQPGQFQINRPYLFSVRLVEEFFPDERSVRYLRLIGYD